jgi:carboxypeptidase T
MKRIVTVLALVLGLALALSPAMAGPDGGDGAVVVSVAKSGPVMVRLRRMGLDLLMEAGGRVFVVASPADIRRLEAAGLAYRDETGRLAPAGAASEQASGDLNGAFHSYVEVEAELQSLEREFPGLAKLYDLGLSLEGRHVYALKMSANVESDEAEARVLFLGCHHAREWISVEVPLLFGRYALEHYASDPGMKRLLDHSEVWIVPLVNPDGLEYSIFTYRYWRKNRRDNGDGSFGIDLNRNYAYEWGFDDAGSSPDPFSDIYRGPAASSEPETRAVEGLIASRGFQALISYHSYAQSILYPWGYTDAPAPDAAKLGDLAAGMAARIEPVNGRTYSTGAAGSLLYLTNGDLTDWAYGLFGVMAFTIELPPMDYFAGNFFNAESQIEPIFLENVPAMEYLIDRSLALFAESAPAKPASRPGTPSREARPVKH